MLFIKVQGTYSTLNIRGPKGNSISHRNQNIKCTEQEQILRSEKNKISTHTKAWITCFTFIITYEPLQ